MRNYPKYAMAVAATLAAATTATATATPAQAAPSAPRTAKVIPVQALPPFSFQIGYMMIPNWAGFPVQARSLGHGKVKVTAPLSKEQCFGGGGNFGLAKVHIHYTNLNTGKRGSTWVQPCQADSEYPQRKLESVIIPGRGRVVTNLNVTNVPAPAPGALNTPGVATFVVP